jgi:hypothetical protein
MFVHVHLPGFDFKNLEYLSILKSNDSNQTLCPFISNFSNQTVGSLG